MKCRCQRARFGSASHLVIGAALCAERLSSTTWMSRSRGDVQVDQLEERQHVGGRCGACGCRGGPRRSPTFMRGEQVRRAVALVVVGHRPSPARLHRQARLGAVQRLDLGLLVEAEHHRPLWRIQVEPDDVDELLLEVRIVGDLEGLDLPRLEVVVPSRCERRCPCRSRTRSAIVRVVQCVDPSSGGSSSVVTRTTSATVPSGSHDLRPRPGAIRPTPPTPCPRIAAATSAPSWHSTSNRRAIS